MNALIILGSLAVSGLAQTGQTASFTNTSFAGPFAVGESVPLMWTTGNGLPVTLSIANASWNAQVFAGRAILPTSYGWTVEAWPGFVSGNYQLALQQVNGGDSISPVFAVTVPESVNATMAMPAPNNAATVTYIYWDHECGCKMTGTASSSNTGLPMTTTSWWDDECGCQKSALAPVATVPAANNYTVPAAPPMTAVQATSAAAQPAVPAASAQATFKGGAVGLGVPGIGAVAVMAIAALIQSV